MSDMLNLQAAVNQAAQHVQATWQQVVMGSVSVPGAKEITANIGLRRLYADNIVLSSQLKNGDNLTQRVMAIKQIANQLETGCGPFDMKPALLNGPKSRVSKKGIRYNIVPFRHAAPGGTKDSNFRAMPASIYQKARELKATVQKGNKLAWGGRLKSPLGIQSNPTTGYKHKAPIHEGMVRIEKQYAKASQSKYLTFRMVSSNSDPGSWIHPGYEAHHIAAAVSNFCRPAVEAMVHDAAVADLLQASVSMEAN